MYIQQYVKKKCRSEGWMGKAEPPLLAATGKE